MTNTTLNCHANFNVALIYWSINIAWKIELLFTWRNTPMYLSDLSLQMVVASYAGFLYQIYSLTLIIYLIKKLLQSYVRMLSPKMQWLLEHRTLSRLHSCKDRLYIYLYITKSACANCFCRQFKTTDRKREKKTRINSVLFVERQRVCLCVWKASEGERISHDVDTIRKPFTSVSIQLNSCCRTKRTYFAVIFTDLFSFILKIFSTQQIEVVWKRKTIKVNRFCYFSF